MIQVGEKILGIQGHPEFTKAYDRLLMENRVEKMGKSNVEAGIKSLDLPIHPQLIVKWVHNFLKNRL